MSDYFPGQIEIGGDISRKDLNILINIVVNMELKDEDYSDVWTREKLVEAFATQDSVFMTDDQARYGEFPELEAWLVEYKISFNRHSDAQYEYDAVNTYCRVDGKKAILNTVYSTQNDEDLLPYSVIKNIVNDNFLGNEQKVKEIRRITNKITVLPKLVII